MLVVAVISFERSKYCVIHQEGVNAYKHIIALKPWNKTHHEITSSSQFEIELVLSTLEHYGICLVQVI
jgi:hypothetical protein